MFPAQRSSSLAQVMETDEPAGAEPTTGLFAKGFKDLFSNGSSNRVSGMHGDPTTGLFAKGRLPKNSPDREPPLSSPQGQQSPVSTLVPPSDSKKCEGRVDSTERKEAQSSPVPTPAAPPDSQKLKKRGN
jgi:hypothetical protein